MNETYDDLLKVLNLHAADFGRFRSIYREDGNIVVRARVGGGNREEYEDVFKYISEHPMFLYDEDDDFDPTYCYFYFENEVT